MAETVSGPVSSAVVLGIVIGLLLWLMNYTDPVTMIFIIIVLAILLGVAVGIPVRHLIHKLAAERQALAAYHATPSPAGSVVPSGTPTFTAAPVAAAAPATAPAAAAAPPGPPPPFPPWPLFEPLVFLETSMEKDLLQMARNAEIPPDRLLLLLAFSSDYVLQEMGLGGVETVRISRVEAEDVVPPGDLDKIGYLIEKHLSRGTGYKVVLSSIETLVEANGPKNVRRLLDVAREVAQTSRGSVLVSLDPKALSKDPVAMLTRGAAMVKAPPA